MLRLLPVPPAGASENLALDAMLFRCMEAGAGTETLRLWESPEPVVVLGRSGVVSRDVEEGAPVLRRDSGGGAVLLGPGCMVYSLHLSLEQRPALRDVRASHRLILGCVARALALPGLEIRGIADLAIGDRKVSGSAQRRGSRALLHHGTLLYAMDGALLAKYLKEPARRPDYRQARRHEDFVTNLPLSAAQIARRLTRLPDLLDSVTSASPRMLGNLLNI